MKNSSKEGPNIMFLGLLENIKESFRYSFHNTFRRPLFWLGLTLVVIAMSLCITGCIYFRNLGLFGIYILCLVIYLLLRIFFLGIDVKILGNEDLTFKGFTKTIVDGFKFLIVILIYGAIALLIFLILFFTGVLTIEKIYVVSAIISLFFKNNFSTDLPSYVMSAFFSDGVTALNILSLILLIVLSLFAFLIMTLAAVNFARSGGKIIAAFKFHEMHARIKKLGILKFYLALIIFALIIFVVTVLLSAIVGVIGLIPNETVGDIISIIVIAPVYPTLFLIFPIKYVGNLFVD